MAAGRRFCGAHSQSWKQPTRESSPSASTNPSIRKVGPGVGWLRCVLCFVDELQQGPRAQSSSGSTCPFMFHTLMLPCRFHALRTAGYTPCTAGRISHQGVTLPRRFFVASSNWFGTWIFSGGEMSWISNLRTEISGLKEVHSRTVHTTRETFFAGTRLPHVVLRARFQFRSHVNSVAGKISVVRAKRGRSSIRWITDPTSSWAPQQHAGRSSSSCHRNHGTRRHRCRLKSNGPLMCGVVGILLADRQAQVSPELYDGLTILQHRGQDAAGIATSNGRKMFLRKDKGLVRTPHERTPLCVIVVAAAD